jgi:hypothetical protein
VAVKYRLQLEKGLAEVGAQASVPELEGVAVPEYYPRPLQLNRELPQPPRQRPVRNRHRWATRNTGACDPVVLSELLVGLYTLR